METVIISSTNYNGYLANITFYPITGGTVSLGYHQIPYLYSSNQVYGSYDLYFSSWTKTCSTTILPQPVFITANTSFFTLQVLGTASQINWGDGSPLEVVTNGTLTHTYSIGGNYVISFIPVNLTSLIISNNGITSISLLPASLTTLDIHNNNLSSLNISNLLTLTTLNCNNNYLGSLDIQFNLNLINIDVSYNTLLSFDFGTQQSLTVLTVSHNSLTDIDFTNNLNLTYLYCNNNNISTLTFDDTGGSIYSLSILDISNNNLSTITLCFLDYLNYVYCQYNSLTTLGYLPYNLNTLNCSYNLLTTLPFDSCFGGFTYYLTNLNCSNNQLSSLDITGVSIYQLDATYNELDSTNIDNILVNLQNGSYTNGTALLNNQTPSACPTGIGMLAEDYLINDLGWTITVDPGCQINLMTITFTGNPISSVYLDFGGFYNGAINWGDGSPIQNFNSYVTHDYYTAPHTAKLGFSDNNSIIQIYSPNNGVTDITGLDLFPSMYIVNLSNNYLTVSKINDILVTLSGNSLSNGECYLDNQIPPACPTGDGILAQNHLVDDLFWIVNVDTGC